MINKLVYANDSERPKIPGATDPDTFSRLPTPHTEVSQEDFFRQFFYWTPTEIEFRNLNEGGRHNSARIFYYSGVAFAWVHPNVGEKDHPMGRFYRLGCAHPKTTTQNLGRCYNQHTCNDCGHVWTVDSSD